LQTICESVLLISTCLAFLMKTQAHAWSMVLYNIPSWRKPL